MQVQKAKQGYKIVKSLFGTHEIPENWNLAKLGEHSTLYVPMRDKPKKFDGEIDWLRIEDFDGKYVSHSKSNQKVSLETIKEMKLRVYPVGTVLCSCSASIGAYAITAKELITNQTFIGIYPNDNLDKEFLYYYFNTQTNNLIKIGSGTTILYISREKFEEFPIVLPPIIEQQKIASILSNVDSLIDQTQKIIEQTQRLKKGLMRKLLTRGIGHTKFKKVKWLFGTEIEIPEDWQILSTRDTGIKIIDGDRGDEYPKEIEFMKLGYCLFLSAKNVTKNGFSFNDCLFISKEKDEKLRNGRLAREDIVITTRGTVGNVAYFDKSIPNDIIRINSGMVILRNNTESILQQFLYYLLTSYLITIQLKSIVFGSAQPQLTVNTINSLKIIVPHDVSEQHKITSILSNVNSQIQKQQEYKSKLETLKKGLMQKLLTGQIRVKI